MARIRLEQILSPLKFSGSVLTVTGSDFVVSGSSTFIQQNTSSFAIASSGSLYIIDSKPPITGSLEGNPLDGGSF
jgi:hypothetical protein